jgi:hypothetical protein
LLHLRTLRSPFLVDFPQLIAIDTHDVKDPAVLLAYRTLRSLGKAQSIKWRADVLDNRTSAIQDPITKNKLALFTSPPVKEPSKAAMQLSAVKDTAALFGHMYIACQHRQSDLPSFFALENANCPPSLAVGDKLRSGNKSDLLALLEVAGAVEPGILLTMS